MKFKNFSKSYLQDKFATKLNRIWILTRNIAVTNQQFVGQTARAQGRTTLVSVIFSTVEQKFKLSGADKCELDTGITKTHCALNQSQSRWIQAPKMLFRLTGKPEIFANTIHRVSLFYKQWNIPSASVVRVMNFEDDKLKFRKGFSYSLSMKLWWV